MILYKILNVNQNATDSEIQSAYRNLVKIHHPDMKGGDHEKFIEIQSAYQTLIDPLKRSNYDKNGKFHDVSFEEKFQSFTKDVIQKVINRSDVVKKNLIILVVDEINIQRAALKNKVNIRKHRIKQLKEVEKRLIHNKFSDSILINSIKSCIKHEESILNVLLFDINFLNSCQEIVQGYDYNFSKL